MNTMTLTCGAWPSPGGPGLIVSNTKRFSRIRAGAAPTEAREAQVGAARIGGMGVASLGVGLPDLEHGVGHRGCPRRRARGRRCGCARPGSRRRPERNRPARGRDSRTAPGRARRRRTDRPSARASAAGACLRSPSASRCAAEHDIEHVAERELGLGHVDREAGDQARAGAPPALPGRSGPGPEAGRPGNTSA